jgi:hypothetical protein
MENTTIALWFEQGNLDPLVGPTWHIESASYTALTDFWLHVATLRRQLEMASRTGQTLPAGRREERTLVFGASGSRSFGADDVVLLYQRHDPPDEIMADAPGPVREQLRAQALAPTFDYLMGSCPTVVQLHTAEFVMDVVRRNGVGMMIARNQAEQMLQEQVADQVARDLAARGQDPRTLFDPRSRRIN